MSGGKKKIPDRDLPRVCGRINRLILSNGENDILIGHLLTDIEQGREKKEFEQVIAQLMDMRPGIAYNRMRKYQRGKVLQDAGVLEKLTPEAVTYAIRASVDLDTLHDVIKFAKNHKRIIRADVEKIYRARHPKNEVEQRWLKDGCVAWRQRRSHDHRFIDVKISDNGTSVNFELRLGPKKAAAVSASLKRGLVMKEFVPSPDVNQVIDLLQDLRKK